MIHRNQVMNFRTVEAPFGGSFYSFLLRPRFQYMNVGDLLETIMDRLWALTGVRTNRVDFTLVNVCSPFTKFSHGFCSEPPVSARPTGTHLIFTFAVSQMQAYDLEPAYLDMPSENHVRIHDNATRQWSPVAGQVDFVSVSISAQESHWLGLRQPKPSELEYLYNLIGPATKSIIRRQTHFVLKPGSYVDDHEGLNLQKIHDQVFALPIKELMKRMPYHLWVFNRDIWRYAPNLLPSRLITPSAVLYFFMFLVEHVPQTYRCSGDIGMARLGMVKGVPSGILFRLATSVLAFIQMVKSPDDVQLSHGQLVIPSLISTLLRTDTNVIPGGLNYRARLSEQATMLCIDLHERVTDIPALLKPREQTALSLMRGDLAFIDQLRFILGLDEEASSNPVEET